MAGSENDADDPATRLLRRTGLAILIGGFVVFMVPRAVIGLASGEPDRQVAAVIGLGFWAWLVSRLVLQFRNRDAKHDPRFWYTSAAGYALFAVVHICFAVYVLTQGSLSGSTLVFPVLVAGLAVVSAVAGHRVANNRTATETVH